MGHRVLATDISQNVLRTAVNAVYEEDSLKELSPAWKKKYFRPGSTLVLIMYHRSCGTMSSSVHLI